MSNDMENKPLEEGLEFLNASAMRLQCSVVKANSLCEIQDDDEDGDEMDMQIKRGLADMLREIERDAERLSTCVMAFRERIGG